ncbi:glycosyltransferase family 2 protein [Pontibacter sp. Tf4]|uniref:glycosyltransferase family 2 protein n=1 Tax=Pontibacter sp. Tf4 TaxID=2761620 RepID=UPI00162AB7E1|nr:glycosyltransferase family 2 protein [Pontibacter sp. Tf4]MBB6611401.1 glycosyltransferase family 2 protein [Pontibacter sp. Tf4]
MVKPFVSIVLCVYNGEQFLKEQLDSVLSQTYPNFELLILDDCSTDNSFALAAAYAEKHSNIRLLQNDTNLGFNRNFEKGIQLSNGDLIAICDQDDIWLPTKIEELADHIGSAVLIYSNSELMDEHGQPTNKTLDHNLIHLNRPSYSAFLESNFITGHTCIFKKELIPYILPLPASINYYDWWIGMVAAYVGEVKYYDKTLTRYRIHTDSVMQQEKQQAETRLAQMERKQKVLRAFTEMAFVKPRDRQFVERFLLKKKSAGKGIIQYINCYLFLLQHHRALYPWYAKSFVKKLNFIRKQCH